MPARFYGRHEGGFVRILLVLAAIFPLLWGQVLTAVNPAATAQLIYIPGTIGTVLIDVGVVMYVSRSRISHKWLWYSLAVIAPSMWVVGLVRWYLLGL